MANSNIAVLLQKKILQAYDNGNNQVFTRIWTENIPEQLQEENSCKRLEFNIQLYFAIFAIKQESPDQVCYFSFYIICAFF